MAATVQIHRLTSSAGNTVSTDITATTNRAQTDDLVGTGAPTGSPVPIPSGGTTNYAYWVTTRLFVATAPAGTINNIKWYTDGANSMGTGVTCAGQGLDPAKYVRATGTPGTTGTALNSTNHSGLVDSGGTASTTVDIFSYSSGSPKTLSGTISATTGYVGQGIVYQPAVTSAAGPGTTTAETITWQYNET